jgi:TolA-binding protein
LVQHHTETDTETETETDTDTDTEPVAAAVASAGGSPRRGGRTAKPSPAPTAPPAARESQLIDRARHALRGWDLTGARAALDEHTQRFPTGALAEERDVLRIEALVLGKDDNAAARAIASYQRAFPHGLHAGRVALAKQVLERR